MALPRGSPTSYYTSVHKEKATRPQAPADTDPSLLGYLGEEAAAAAAHSVEEQTARGEARSSTKVRGKGPTQAIVHCCSAGLSSETRGGLVYLYREV